jgi:uncharacterized protein (DUF433 family)
LEIPHGVDDVAKAAPHYQERIIQDLEILAGKPVVKGTRIPVELVLAKLAQNPDLDELIADYPRITTDELKACLEYARDRVGHTSTSWISLSS